MHIGFYYKNGILCHTNLIFIQTLNITKFRGSSTDDESEDKEEKKREVRFKVSYPKNSPPLIGLKKAQLTIQSAIRGPEKFPQYHKRFPSFTGK